MFRVFTCLSGEHDGRLVVLAVAICLITSIVAIGLFEQACATRGRVRAAWLALAGAATGCGIWATHFIAMLAYEPGIPIAYDVGLTALSLILAAIATGAGLSVASRGSDRRLCVLGGSIVGAGVAVMHYIGMGALRIPGHVAWSTGLVTASILAGILFASIALAVAVRHPGLMGRLVSASLLTLAITAHHFIAMGAVEIIPDPTRGMSGFSISPPMLAISVASVTVALLSIVSAFVERRLRERDRQFATAVNNMSHGVSMYDEAERLLICNDRYLAMYGLSRDVAKPGAPLMDILRHRFANGFLPEHPDSYRTWIRSVLAGGKTTTLTIDRPDGRSVTVTVQPMGGGAFVATHEDTTERRRAEQRIAYLAHHDVLTGLPNRAAFRERIAAAIDWGRRRGAGVAVLCLDLDRLKETNDAHGHAAGDQMLREMAMRFRVAADGGEAFTARLGGDEFVVIARTDERGALLLAERLRACADEDVMVEGHPIRAGVSIGVALFPEHGADATTLMANADAALYRAKAQGRGAVRLYETGMRPQLHGNRRVQHDLARALARMH